MKISGLSAAAKTIYLGLLTLKNLNIYVLMKKGGGRGTKNFFSRNLSGCLSVFSFNKTSKQLNRLDPYFYVNSHEP